jgi:hypothetical protein
MRYFPTNRYSSCQMELVDGTRMVLIRLSTPASSALRAHSSSTKMNPTIARTLYKSLPRPHTSTITSGQPPWWSPPYTKTFYVHATLATAASSSSAYNQKITTTLYSTNSSNNNTALTSLTNWQEKTIMGMILMKRSAKTSRFRRMISC